MDAARREVEARISPEARAFLLRRAAARQQSGHAAAAHLPYSQAPAAAAPLGVPRADSDASRPAAARLPDSQMSAAGAPFRDPGAEQPVGLPSALLPAPASASHGGAGRGRASAGRQSTQGGASYCGAGGQGLAARVRFALDGRVMGVAEGAGAGSVDVVLRDPLRYSSCARSMTCALCLVKLRL